jgi:hypothetical protein
MRTVTISLNGDGMTNLRSFLGDDVDFNSSLVRDRWVATIPREDFKVFIDRAYLIILNGKLLDGDDKYCYGRYYLDGELDQTQPI